MARRGARLFWCGDDCFRGCILRNVFNKEFKVLIPVSTPSQRTKKLPKRGSTFLLHKASKLAHTYGCNELEEIDKEWCVSKGQGDIDFAVEISRDIAFVAEVKTRLIPMIVRRYGLEIAKLMLQYHLDEPKRANDAWKKLVKHGIIKPPSCLEHKRAGGYDKPSSIAELTRSVLGFLTTYRYSKVIVGAISMCFINPLLSDVLEFVDNTRNYLKRCGVSVLGSCVIVIYPSDFNDIPKEVTLQCYGDGCEHLRLRKTTYSMNDLLLMCPEYHGCNECVYRNICMKYCYTNA